MQNYLNSNEALSYNDLKKLNISFTSEIHVE